MGEGPQNPITNKGRRGDRKGCLAARDAMDPVTIYVLATLAASGAVALAGIAL